MSYLLDKKNQKRKILNYAIAVFFIVLIFYFRTSIFSFLASFTNIIFRPALVLKNNINTGFYNFNTNFNFKNSLLKENADLKTKMAEKDATMLNYNSILDENNKIKEILNRKNSKTEMILSAILGKPNQNLYDTLMIDTGTNDGIKEGDLVFALGNIPIGHIFTIYANSSKVILFSNPGEKTEVVVGMKDAYMEIVGRGGGNFEMILPRDFVLEKGSVVSLPGIFPYVVATVETTISDPRDSFAKALLVSPVNIQELKFVQVKL